VLLTPGRREETELRPCCVAPQDDLLIASSPQNLLKRCHGSQASYLFQQDKFYDVALDTGDKVVQCGRRVDCLKLWLMWKAQGGQGLERRIDQAFALTR
jgi:sulfinoalanine decarboxylase